MFNSCEVVQRGKRDCNSRVNSEGADSAKTSYSIVNTIHYFEVSQFFYGTLHPHQPNRVLFPAPIEDISQDDRPYCWVIACHLSVFPSPEQTRLTPHIVRSRDARKHVYYQGMDDCNLSYNGCQRDVIQRVVDIKGLHAAN